jgi:MFS family permease
MTVTPRGTGFAAFAYSEFRWLLLSVGCASLVGQAVPVIVGYQVYEMTGNVLSLGMLGLVEAIPSLSLALFGGHVADRMDRRKILQITLATITACTAAFAILSRVELGEARLIFFYTVVFVLGFARGFSSPAVAALEAQVVDRHILVNASAWMGSVFLGAAILGPVMSGFCYAALGPSWTYALLAALIIVALFAVTQIGPKPIPVPPSGESVWQSITAGVHYVVTNQVLVGSMALDLFAVLFGGVIALLPAFAADILHVGPRGLGLLNGATAAGSLLSMLWAARHPPLRNTGLSLLTSVAGFGVCIILFAFSTNFYLSLFALAMSGVFDGTSMVIRRSIVRIVSPNALRGRIASVNMIFIGSSNQLGALESGLAAWLLGLVPSVWLGATVTLLVVAITARLAPKLRTLNLDQHTLVPELAVEANDPDSKLGSTSRA